MRAMGVQLTQTLHALKLSSRAPYWLYLLALVLWPLMIGVPAFAGFVGAEVLTLVSPRESGSLLNYKHIIV